MLPLLLGKKFRTRLSLTPAKDFRYEKVKIEIVPFGPGSVKSNPGIIDFDSEQET
ncbi:MAG: hypothetical protein R2941_21005 [Desulfobacterales bacterium]